MSKLNFSLKGQNETPAKFVGQARQFSIVVDEPPVLGGNDDAPNPVEYLLAAYAGCLNVVFHVVAKELSITIHKLHIQLNGDINPEKFLGIADKERAGFQSLQVSIDLQSDAKQTQIDELLKKVKDRCPVYDNLANPTPINVFLKQPVFYN